MHVESEMAAIGCRPLIALEIDGVSAILDLVADGAGFAVLPRNAVMRSVRPSAFSVRPISEPALHIQLTTAVSSQRPTTLTQQATLALLTGLAQQWLTPA
jgi:LysR family nitrogen assimilation transcriptional regulator